MHEQSIVAKKNMSKNKAALEKLIRSIGDRAMQQVVKEHSLKQRHHDDGKKADVAHRPRKLSRNR